MVDLGEFAEYFPDNDGDTYYSINAYSPMYAAPASGARCCSAFPSTPA